MMMIQYFEETPDLKDEEKNIKYPLANEILNFTTNSGLFAKDHIDEYSIKLIENIKDHDYHHILDLGCGYGFIGIVLAKRYPDAHVVFSDITKKAIKYTTINVQQNNIKNATIKLEDGIKSGAYDLITLNPPIHAGKQVCYQLYQAALAHLSENGRLYIVIHKKHGAKSTLRFLEEQAEHVEVVYQKKGLFIIEAKNK
jgi:16S rRNA (guanine1207-N2)-methyltransferase